MNEKNLPIKMILKSNDHYHRNEPSSVKQNYDKFGIFSESVSNQIVSQLTFIKDFYHARIQENDNSPIVGKVILKDEAIAKTYRPTALFKECRIIGVGKFNELYISVTPKGLSATIKTAKNHSSQIIKYNMMTISYISTYSNEDRIGKNLSEFLRVSPKKDTVNLRITLFDFRDDEANTGSRKRLFDTVSSMGYSIKSQKTDFISFVKKSEESSQKKSDYYYLENTPVDCVGWLSNIEGIKEIDLVETFFSPSMQDAQKFDFDLGDIAANDTDVKIGIIDSGISENSILEKHVFGREVFVPQKYQNRNHGTMVASMIMFGNKMNSFVEKEKTNCSFLDVIVMPNSDKNYGPTETVSGDDLIEMIRQVLEKYHNEVKIWNLSLGSQSVFANDFQISPIGETFDRFQKEYDVQFIISAGNIIDTGLLRRWPIISEPSELERISIPSDSIRSITVGSIASLDSDSTLTTKNMPSPFSRKGPGAFFTIKPELTDFGGNCDKNLNCTNVGMTLISENNRYIEKIGTSFSAPRISYKFAKIFSQMLNPDLLLSKALLIHNASVNLHENRKVRRTDFDYFGFGMPSNDFQDILFCSKNEITLVFNQEIDNHMYYEPFDFPYPKCLVKDGHYTGKVFVTLVIDPILDSTYGNEYCRTNVDVHLGTYYLDEDGKKKFKKTVPVEVKWDQKYEDYQIRNGFKWSPVKSHFAEIGAEYKSNFNWNLKLEFHQRSLENIPKQRFVLIVTVVGDEDQDVYSDVFQQLNSKGYIVENLETRSQIRQRT